MLFFFASDLHGATERFGKLWDAVRVRKPQAVLLGGDLLPFGPSGSGCEDFVSGCLTRNLEQLREDLGGAYPKVILILGNDDPRAEEARVLALAASGLIEYAHWRRIEVGPFSVYGYAYVPPTPFTLKDWERYDVSRYADPGCLTPEEGVRSVPVSESEARYSTIARDLAELAGAEDLSRAVFLFHSPPYRSTLDRASLDGKTIDHVPLDVHVGSIAIRRFIEARQPAVTLHGHIHESTRLTGTHLDRIGRTVCVGAAHDGPQLCLVSFDPEHPEEAVKELL
ncbi:MAG: metallophosphoesterase [Myxococcota bacterium]|nr:metallophosphoesterase [Myxococcota bacterium]